jgi:phosphotransferase system enzyme I (PtsI)
VRLSGVGIGRGIAVGTVRTMAPPPPDPIDEASSLSVEAEKGRALDALGYTASSIRELAARVGGTAGDVLEAQALMVEDPTLGIEVDAALAAGKTAERAVFEAFSTFRALLAGLGGHMGERAADLDDISRRVVARLRGIEPPGVPDPDHPFVLVAHDLAPADTALLDLDKVLAFVTSEGGPTSHTAILAREKSIVAIVGVGGAAAISTGSLVVVDAAAGVVTVDPDAQEIAAARSRIAARAAAAPGATGPGMLADGTPVPLLANLGSVEGAAEALKLGAEGVGLFRTEFLFLDSSSAPSVAEQRDQFMGLFEAFSGKKVVVRVLDAGADKPLSFLNDAVEQNPALGLRGLRALRAHEMVLRDQLTAIRDAASACTAEVWVMAPMVSTLEEARYFTGLARELGVATAGVMIEVPSSALLADRILVECDFASIGTNDLTQYTLAADRLLGSVASFQDPWHPAVLRLVAEVGRAGERLRKPVGICGEAAADPLLAVVLVGLGATSLSMSPAALADVRAELLLHSLEDTQRLAELALAADSAQDARAAVLAG